MTKTDLILKKNPSAFPKLIVFDLDYTLWSTWIDCTSGPPYTYDEVSNCIINSDEELLNLFPYSTAIFGLIKSFPDTKIGIASRTSTPDWAFKALKLLRVPELSYSTLFENIDYFEIYPGSKLNHFKSLSEKSGIPFHEMLFFDDEHRNREVSKLGVHFFKVNTQTGITPFQFENALHAYESNSGMKQSSVKDYFKK